MYRAPCPEPVERVFGPTDYPKVETYHYAATATSPALCGRTVPRQGWRWTPEHTELAGAGEINCCSRCLRLCYGDA